MKADFAKLKHLIERFANAQQELSWVGAAHPDDMPNIEQEYETAKALLDAHIRLMEITNDNLKKSDPVV